MAIHMRSSRLREGYIDNLLDRDIQDFAQKFYGAKSYVAVVLQCVECPFG